MSAGRLAFCRWVGIVCFCLLTGIPAHSVMFGNITINGRVSLPDGHPAPRITVNLAGSNGFSMNTMTDDQGSYSFEAIPPGFYTLTITTPPDAKYRAEPVSLNTTHDGPTFMVNIYTKFPLDSALPKEVEKPVISAKEAAQRIPKDAKNAFKKAQRFKEKKDFDAALAELDKATRAFPDYFQAFSERGIIQIQAGRPGAALQDFEKAMQILPEYAPAVGGAGYCFLTLGKFDRSAALLEKAVDLDPRNAQSLMFLGIANLGLSRWRQAQQSLEQALKVDPEGAVSAHIYLGDAYAGQHQYIRAIDEIRTYLQLNPAAPNAARLRERESRWRTLLAQEH